MLLDADTRVQPGYFAAALPMFDHPQVVAVAGCVRTARDRRLSLSGQVLVGHRDPDLRGRPAGAEVRPDLAAVQRDPIVPGFASMYRTEVLPRLEMNPPGLVIEDFNMTFEVYQKRLGKVGFTLRAVAVTQDPDNLRDYIRQTKRWALGLWQTVRRHPPRANLFTAMLVLLLLELITSSVLFFLLPLSLLVLADPGPGRPGAVLAPVRRAAPGRVRSPDADRRAVRRGAARLPDHLRGGRAGTPARLLLLAVFFPFMRMLDAAISLYSVPAAWLSAVQRPLEEPCPPPGGRGRHGIALRRRPAGQRRVPRWDQG